MSIEQHYTKVQLRHRRYVAVCSCGRQSEEQISAQKAEDEATDHVVYTVKSES